MGAATTGTVTANWTAPPANGGPAITGYELVVSSGGTVVRTVTGIPRTATTRAVTGLVNGTTYTVAVRARTCSVPDPVGAVQPGHPGRTARRADRRGRQPRQHHRRRLLDGTRVQRRRRDHRLDRPGPDRRDDRAHGRVTQTTTGTTVTGLTNGTAYNFRVQAVNAAGAGALSTQSNGVTPATVPGAPVILAPTQGPAGGTLTAVANWAAPAVTGGAAITNYRVTALRHGGGRDDADRHADRVDRRGRGSDAVVHAAGRVVPVRGGGGELRG